MVRADTACPGRLVCRRTPRGCATVSDRADSVDRRCSPPLTNSHRLARGVAAPLVLGSPGSSTRFIGRVVGRDAVLRVRGPWPFPRKTTWHQPSITDNLCFGRAMPCLGLGPFGLAFRTIANKMRTRRRASHGQLHEVSACEPLVGKIEPGAIGAFVYTPRSTGSTLDSPDRPRHGSKKDFLSA
jgi:hypothetical protein